MGITHLTIYIAAVNYYWPLTLSINSETCPSGTARCEASSLRGKARRVFCKSILTKKPTGLEGQVRASPSSHRAIAEGAGVPARCRNWRGL